MQTRKNFLLAGISLTALLAFFKWKDKPSAKSKTMKFLTQEGKLVEIDLDKMPSAKRTASSNEVQQWIKK